MHVCESAVRHNDLHRSHCCDHVVVDDVDDVADVQKVLHPHVLHGAHSAI